MESKLAEALAVRDVADVKTPCSFTRIMSKMNAEEMEALDTALARVISDTRSGRAKVYSYEWLASVLKDHGYSISPSTIARHATRRCGCV